MELKGYQKRVIADLTSYVNCINATEKLSSAYEKFWNDKGVSIGLGGVPAYQDILPDTPNVCFKVPTGGGKTFLACASIKPILDALPQARAKVVAWLVPSDTILTQTIENLTNPEHPYHQRIKADFSGRVEIYTKEQLLSGQNFSPTAISEQLSIFVLSFDSFRTGKKDGRKAYQENSNLMPFRKAYGAPERVIEGADETALIQIINQLTPLVIVDESHHARSDLSLAMLRDLNPRFVLDLTATPRKESNIISYVDAMQLKKENMVKLPVIVYNRDNQHDVILDAIDLRNHLEERAIKEHAITGKYIRPIVLFQAQPKGQEDNTTFQLLKEKLVKIGLPADQIAIKTANVNELNGKPLLSPACKIRYIITVNALKEGWDCPFAYILATLANKTSQVDVEQIVGRILRQPHTTSHQDKALNRSYVLTSSNDFQDTLDRIVKGLNSAGFSAKDCRYIEQPELIQPQPEYRQASIEEQQAQEPTEEFLAFDEEQASKDLVERQKASEQGTAAGGAVSMLSDAQERGDAYDQAVNEAGANSAFNDIPLEVRDKMKIYPMNPEFAEEAKALMIPQFYREVPDSLFTDGHSVLLTKEHLAESFTLKGKPYNINFDSVDDAYKVDVEYAQDFTPRYLKMEDSERDEFRKLMASLPEESRVRHCKAIIHKALNKKDNVDSAELRAYIDRIIGDMTREQLALLEQAPLRIAKKIEDKIDLLLKENAVEQFRRWQRQGAITCKPHYQLPETVSPLSIVDTIGHSLYAAEEGMNPFEKEVVLALTGMNNVKWWHRNPRRSGFFYLNGFIYHHPDFIVMTRKCNVILVETKGDYLANDDSDLKVMLGEAWTHLTEPRFRYFMVFQHKDLNLEGALPFDEFREVMKGL